MWLAHPDNLCIEQGDKNSHSNKLHRLRSICKIRESIPIGSHRIQYLATSKCPRFLFGEVPDEPTSQESQQTGSVRCQEMVIGQEFGEPSCGGAVGLSITRRSV